MENPRQRSLAARIARRIEGALRRRWNIVRQLHWPADGSWRRTPDGLWMFLRPGDFFDACYAYASPDPSYRLLVPHAVRAGDWAIDVGGQKGWYAMQLGRAVGRTGRVLTIEADPAAADLLQANLDRNGCANISLVREAAGEAARDVEFCLNEYIGWSSRTPNVHQQASVQRRVMVPMRPLDDILAAAAPGPGARVTWLKIDVEGGEAGVLLGAARLLAEQAPLIWMEINPASLSAAGTTAAQLGELLQPYGYRFWRGCYATPRLRRERVWFTPVASLADITMETDVLCVPPSRVSELLPLLSSAPIKV